MRYAYETVPYYRETLREKHLKPEDFQSVDDLGRLPLIDRDFLKENHAEFRSSQFPDDICTQGGSKAVGITTYYDPCRL